MDEKVILLVNDWILKSSTSKSDRKPLTNCKHGQQRNSNFEIKHYIQKYGKKTNET